MTKNKLLLIIVFLVVIIGIVLLISFKPTLPLTLNGELVVPEYVSVFLVSFVEKNERIPVLILSAVAGGGCDSASELKTKKTLNGNKLVIDIKGYKFKKGSGEICPTVILESKAKVNIDANWLKQSGDKEIIFELNKQENKYKLLYSQYKVTLSGIEATNVITNRPGYNPSEEPVLLEITLYPTDVAVMYLAGYVSSSKDYRAVLNSFAQEKGFVPADQVYEGVEQTEKNWLYVVVSNTTMPEPNRAESLGELPGEPRVGVYLKRIVNEADHY